MRMRNVNKMEMCIEMSDKLKPVVYVAGLFSNGDRLPKQEQERNRNILRYYSLLFMKRGFSVISPIENDQWAYDLGLVTYDDVIESDLAVIKKCDYIFFVPGWEDGHGTVIEHDFAVDNGITILYQVPTKSEVDLWKMDNEEE